MMNKGYYGSYGGQFIPETLRMPLEILEKELNAALKDRKFMDALHAYQRDYIGRPTILYFAEKLTRHFGGARIYLKREDLCHTGSHKLNNSIGQALLACRMGKKRVIAETGAGQHGVATATVAALLGLKCAIYMGEEDMKRQELNVFRMQLMGAEVVPVHSGTRTLKDAVNEAFRDWVTNVNDTFYIFGSVMGPHPYPFMVREFQSIIGREARRQIMRAEGRLPDFLVACVGGGSNSLGLFSPFYGDKKTKLIGVEAAGAASIGKGEPGILHGMKTYVLQDKNGQIEETHSISAGLDYPGIGPEHSFYHDSGRAEYHSVTDKEALTAFRLLSETEGIIPALESSHALAWLPRLAPKLDKKKIIVVCLSGRGDKDVDSVRSLIQKGVH